MGVQDFRYGTINIDAEDFTSGVGLFPYDLE
jgi:hypothetical protein